MNELQVFDNPEFGSVRTMLLDGNPWAVGKDVASALGYGNTRQALATNVDAEDKGVHSVDTPSGTQTMTIINESGIYSLIFSSKLESAKRFKHWVTSEVLPSIRKKGSYSAVQPQETPTALSAEQRALTPDDYIRAAHIVATCRNERLPYVLGFLENGGLNIPDIPVPEKHSKRDDIERDTDGNTARYIAKANSRGITCGRLGSMTGVHRAEIMRILHGECNPQIGRSRYIIEVIRKAIPDIDDNAD